MCMQQEIGLIKFIETMISKRDLISLSFQDFLPIENVIEYRMVHYKDEKLNIDVSEYIKRNTTKIILLFTKSSRVTLFHIEKCITDIKSMFQQNIDIQLGIREDVNSNYDPIYLVFYKD